MNETRNDSSTASHERAQPKGEADLTILLIGPGSSGSRPIADGRHQEPGGWNRVVLRLADPPARIEALNKAGIHSKPASIFGTKWTVRVASKFNWKTPMAMPSSCSSRAESLDPALTGNVN